MAEPLAKIGNFIHVYDLRVKPGSGDEFVRLFEDFDNSRKNVMHGPAEQVHEGVLCRDEADPDHFYLLGEWSDKDVHKALLKKYIAAQPDFMDLLIDGRFQPVYADVVA
jgi:quinol monooxygenase YgiN